jgi:guanylate kinase
MSVSSEKLVLFCGPSGSGKTTIVQHLLKKFPELTFSVSVTTREKRKNEIDKKDYYFLSVEEFKRKMHRHEFLEWEEVYKQRYYGTLKSEVKRILEEGKVVLFDVDVEGGLNIRSHYPKQILDVFVMPPTVDALHKRLIGRASESEDSLAKRISKAEKELEYAYRFSNVLVNDKLDVALKEAEVLVDQFLYGEIPDEV